MLHVPFQILFYPSARFLMDRLWLVEIWGVQRGECQRVFLPSVSWKEARQRPSEPPVLHVTAAVVPGPSQEHPVAASLLHLLQRWCLFGLVVNADDAQVVSSLKKLWRAKLPEYVLQQFHLKVLSSEVSQRKVNAEHYCLNTDSITESKSISIHGKML